MNLSNLGQTKIDKYLLSIKPIHIVGFLILIALIKILN